METRLTSYQIIGPSLLINVVSSASARHPHASTPSIRVLSQGFPVRRTQSPHTKSRNRPGRPPNDPSCDPPSFWSFYRPTAFWAGTSPASGILTHRSGSEAPLAQLLPPRAH